MRSTLNRLERLEEELGARQGQPLKMKFPAWIKRLEKAGYQPKSEQTQEPAVPVEEEPKPKCSKCRVNMVQLYSNSHMLQCPKCYSVIEVNKEE